MNPFDLRGPAFLAFYAFVSAAGLLYMYFATRGQIFGSPRPASSDAYRHLRDPYLVAYLKGGFRHALTIVVFSLHQRKIVTGAGEPELRATRSQDVLAAIHNTLELAVLRSLARPL